MAKCISRYLQKQKNTIANAAKSLIIVVRVNLVIPSELDEKLMGRDLSALWNEERQFASCNPGK